MCECILALIGRSLKYRPWKLEGVVPQFERYIGVDYSGAQTPESSLRGLRVYAAAPANEPCEILPQAYLPLSQRKYWTRREIAEWITDKISSGPTVLVGIDHGFSFPLEYFDTHSLRHNWDTFLDDFQHHWPTDQEDVYVDFVRSGHCGKGAMRSGKATWRRITERRCRAKSVFHFDVQGSVAKSTHSGIPWLRFIRSQTAGRVHFWPFDGWQIPGGKSAIVEVYPALWSRSFHPENRDQHQHDAYSIAAWLRNADGDGSFERFLYPRLNDEERATAEFEGWILGVP
jgi:hypothetical protein